jgi:hypothetical protein
MAAIAGRCDAGGELRGLLAQAKRPVRVIGLELAGSVAQAEMDMHAVADTISRQHRREDGAMAEAEGCGTRHLAGDHGVVRRF